MIADLNNKINALEIIAENIKNCGECKKNKFGLPVPGEGDPNASLMFVGMSPGKKESETGRPFVGRSGKLLTELLSSIGIDRKDIFITSPVKYYEGKRSLTSEEVSHGRTHLVKQIEIIKPELIVLLGKTAIKAVLEEDLKVSDNNGKILERSGMKYFITFHPSAALRSPKIVKSKMLEDFNKLKKLLNDS